MSGVGNDGKKSGMSRAERHANPAWRLAADKAVLKAAKAKSTLTTDDVVVLIPPGLSTHENRALGPVMLAAARDGVIEKDRALPVNCATRKNNHSRPLQVWRSRVYRGRA